MNRNTAAMRIASRAASRGVHLNHYNVYKNAKNALSVLVYPYKRRGVTYTVYAWPNHGTNWRQAAIAQNKIRRVVRNINTNNRYIQKTTGNTIHPPMWKNKSVVNNALKNYFNTHVIPELIHASSPSLKNVAKKRLEVTRERIQRRKNVKNYATYLEGLFTIRRKYPSKT